MPNRISLSQTCLAQNKYSVNPILNWEIVKRVGGE